nr:MAG TPA: hypothetical protein [Caudoviricetes sp.]
MVLRRWSVHGHLRRRGSVLFLCPKAKTTRRHRVINCSVRHT